MRISEAQGIDPKRKGAAVVLFFVLCIPDLAVVAIADSGWGRTAAPPLSAAAFVGIGIVLYTLLFLVLFYALPQLIKRRAGPHVARRWQHAALLATMATAGITIPTTITVCPIEPFSLRLGVAMIAAVLAYMMLLWLMVRHFPEMCRWLR